MTIILIGFKYCGKTSVGRLLAEKMGSSFIDTDHLIERHYLAETNHSTSTRQIYQQKGEVFFRNLEKKIISNLIPNENCIIATGGGSLLEADNISSLKKLGQLVYLSATPQTLLQRLNLHEPPVFLTKNQLKADFIKQYQKRTPIYEIVSDMKIISDNKTISQIIDEIIELLSKRGNIDG